MPWTEYESISLRYSSLTNVGLTLSSLPIMSSSTSGEQPRIPAAGTPGAVKRRTPPPRPAQLPHQDNNEPHAEVILPERSNTLSPPIDRSPSSERRRAPAGGNPPLSKDGNSKPRGLDDLPQRLAPAPGNGDPEKRRIPMPRSNQPRYKENSNPHDEVELQRDSMAWPPSPRKPLLPHSRVAAALKARVRSSGQEPPSGNPGAWHCNGTNCEWRTNYNEAKGGLDLKEKELVATKKMLDEARAEIQKLRAKEKQNKQRDRDQAKQEARQFKLFADEQKRRDKRDAETRKRQDIFEEKRAKRAHELAMEELKTDEERAAERDATLKKAELAVNVAAMAGGLALEAQRTHSESQRARMPPKERHGQTAPRRHGEGSGTRGNVPRPVAARRPALAASAHTPPQGQDIE